jgi:PII-like signaling protein
VNDDCLKLTTYVGERDRVNGRFLADELLALYERHDVAASVLLRGAEGFGLKHHLRSDRLLTLSEDLPVVTVAIDGRERIEAVADELLSAHRPGLLTLERARMLTGEIGPVVLPEALDEATKLTVYLGRLDRAGRLPAFVAVCELLHRHGIDGATAFLGVDGTVHGRRARARFFSRNADVPMMVIAIGAGERVAGVLPQLCGLLRDPLLTLERVRVCKRDGELRAAPHALPATDAQGRALGQKLMVYSSEDATAGGHPIHGEIVRRLRRAGVAGATTLRGIWGFHGDHEPHGDRLLALRRHVPAVTVVVDTPEGIERAFEIVDELTAQRGLVTSELVPAMRVATADGERGPVLLAELGF